jgi:inosine-uridine nucleoside N-ribohydrolase
MVVSLGPLTNLADLARSAPRAYARLAGIHVMAGSVDGPLVDGVAEWNAAADPEAFAAVLAGPAPVTVVPEDAVPDGTPEALDAPVVAPVAAAAALPAWWDLAAAATLVAPDAATVETGRWVLDPAEPGRLRRTADGKVRLVRSLDADLLETAYRRAFG